MNNKRNRFVMLLLVSFIIASILIVTRNVQASPAEWHVYPPGPIQVAINAASPGDTILVHDGTYTEHLVVNKALIIKAASHPIIDGGATGNCISIGANGVVIDGFEIRNGYNGITGQTSGSTFSNNIIHDNLNIPGSAGVGILLWGDNDNNIITGNEIYSNDRQGIFIGYYDTTYISTGNTITHNVIYNNGLYRYANGPDASEYGIQLWNADGNTIEGNEIYYHDDWFPYGGTFDFAQGIYLCDSDDNTIVRNYLHDNNYGVGLWHPARPVGNNHITNNDIVGNTGYGVITYDGSPPAVDARNNWWGHASGPSGVGPGTGDAVSANVNYDPWLPGPWAVDTDNDGLGNCDEVTIYGTDPRNPDTDGGGVNDGTEIHRGTDPLDPTDDIPVGGIWTPINTFQLLAPWIAVALIALAAVAAGTRRLFMKRW